MLINLLDETVCAYYWMGFLSADGTFLNGKRLRLVLSDKDSDHVKLFANYIGCENYYQDRYGFGVAVQDKDIIPRIMTKFDLRTAKTYNPPNDISWMMGDLFLSYFIGFIDGDGCIRPQHGRKDCQLSIKVHSSWLGILQGMLDKLSDLIGVNCPVARIDKNGYANCNIANSIVLKFLKLKIQKLELPALIRKWGHIDENFIGRQEQAVVNRQIVLGLRGLKVSEIAEKAGLSQNTVYKILRNNTLHDMGSVVCFM